MSPDVSDRRNYALDDLRACFEGAVPAAIATAAADGTPNITYLSSVRLVDSERVALSNQFFSKTVRNLAENPRASVLVIDPRTYDQYRLTLAFERTDRRGAVFDRLREDVEVAAAFQGMQGVFKLRAADIYRVTHVEKVVSCDERSAPPALLGEVREPADTAHLQTLVSRLSRCGDLDTLVEATVRGLEELFGYEHSSLMLLAETGDRLYTIASRGYQAEGVGSEVEVGRGVVGTVAAQCRPIRLGNVRQISTYSQTVRSSYESAGEIAAEPEIPVPGLPGANSRLAVPAMSLGELVGVLSVESGEPVAFDETDEAVLVAVASVVAASIAAARLRDRAPHREKAPASVASGSGEPGVASHVRFYEGDGSTFINGDYLIKGVAGRILWSLLREHETIGRVDFTNREVRLDPTLELPVFRDNFESRLILLKRRLDERGSPVRIEKTGRGRFRLNVAGPLRLQMVRAGESRP